MHHFLVFFHRGVLPQPVVTACTTFWSFVTVGCYRSQWWQHAPLSGLFVTAGAAGASGDSMHRFLVFCHRGVLLQPVVTACTIFWSFLSLRGATASGGASMHHFLVFCHRVVLSHLVETACTNFWSSCHPRGCLSRW